MFQSFIKLPSLCVNISFPEHGLKFDTSFRVRGHQTAPSLSLLFVSSCKFSIKQKQVFFKSTFKTTVWQYSCSLPVCCTPLKLLHAATFILHQFALVTYFSIIEFYQTTSADHCGKPPTATLLHVCVNDLPLAEIHRPLQGPNHRGPVSSASLLLRAPS